MNVALAVVAIAVANILGGLSYVWQKLALECGLPPATIAALRSVVAIGLLAGWMALRTGFRWSFTAREWLRLGIIGVVATGVPLVLGVVGVQWSTAGNGSILILLEPAAILFFSWLLLREVIRWGQLLGLAVGLSGAYLVVVGDLSGGLAPTELFAREHVRGNVVLVTHAILWGLYSPVMKPLAERHRISDLTLMVMLLAMVPIVPATILESSQWQVTDRLGEAFVHVLCLGLFPGLIATVFWNYSLRHLRSSSIAPFIFIQPFVGCLAGHLYLGEELTRGALFGAVLIAIAVLLVSYGGEKSGAQSSPKVGYDREFGDGRRLRRMARSMLPSYSICIVHHGDPRLVRDCLRSTRELEPAPVARYVVWNDSDDPPEDVADAAIIISPRSNLGYAGGANLGVRTALEHDRCDAVWLLNNDVEVSRDTIAPLLAAVGGDASVAIAGPRLVERTSGLIWHDGGEIVWPSGQPVSHRYHEPEPEGDADPRETGFVCGCAPLIRATAFDSVDGFDERFFLCFEDADLSVRLRDRGWRLLHVPAARVLHIGSATLGASPPRDRYYRLRNRLLLLSKHSPNTARARRARRAVVAGSWFRALRLLLRGRRPEARAVLRAIADHRRGRWGEAPGNFQ